MRQVLIPDLSTGEFPFLPPQSWRLYRLCGTGLGTEWTTQTYGPPDLCRQQVSEAIEQALSQTVHLFSQWEAQSELSRLNANPAPICGLSHNFAQFLGEVIRLSEQTAGRYDPTLGRLTDLWGFGPSGPQGHAPSPAEVEHLRKQTGIDKLRLDLDRRSLTRLGELHLDFCGSAKGWAAQRISANLSEIGAGSHLVELGGEVVARGLKPDLTPWWIDLEEPDEAAPAVRIALCDEAMATSGNWRRRHIVAGRSIVHTLDPSTGFPIETSIQRVTVLSKDAVEADALATALLTMVPPQALNYCSAHGIPAIMLVALGGSNRNVLSEAACDRIGCR